MLKRYPQYTARQLCEEDPLVMEMLFAIACEESAAEAERRQEAENPSA